MITENAPKIEPATATTDVPSDTLRAQKRSRPTIVKSPIELTKILDPFDLFILTSANNLALLKIQELLNGRRIIQTGFIFSQTEEDDHDAVPSRIFNGIA